MPTGAMLWRVTPLRLYRRWKNAKAWSVVKNNPGSPEAQDALTELNGLSPLYTFVGLVGNSLLFAAFMAFDAYLFLTHDPKMGAGMASLGYPPYFMTILGTAKVLGITALLIPGAPRLKEWAYAGFSFTLIGAFLSHLSSGQQKEAIMPLLAMVILAISYLLRPPPRRILEAAAAVR